MGNFKTRWSERKKMWQRREMEGRWIWEREELGEGLAGEERGELWSRCNIREKSKEKEKRRKEEKKTWHMILPHAYGRLGMPGTALCLEKSFNNVHRGYCI